MDIHEFVGERFSKLRQDKGWSFRYVSEKTDLSYSYISQIEKGKASSLNAIESLCKFYGVSLGELFGNVNHEWVPVVDELQERGYKPEEVLEMVNVFGSIKRLLKN